MHSRQESKASTEADGDNCLVIKNPLAPVEHKGGEGVRNELFEMGLDQFIRGLQ